MGLTGDPLTDRMVPIAARLVGGVREWDAAEVQAAFREALEISPDRGLNALAITLASMVPYNRSPRDLLTWVGRKNEFERLVAHGIDSASAATIIDGWEGDRARPG